MVVARLAFVLLACTVVVGAGGGAPRVTVTAPAAATAGVPWTAVVHVSPAPRAASVPVSVVATKGGERRVFTAAGKRGRYRARVVLTAAGEWTISSRVGGRAHARRVRIAAPTVEHPYAVAVDAKGRVYVADGDKRRILRLETATGRLWVHASGLDEPTGLATAGAELFVADYNAGLVRRVAASGRVSTLARLAQATAVAATASGQVYAVTMDETLARITPNGAITRISVAGGLDRPHGIALDRNGRLLVAEDSRRVRRIDPATGRAELVVDGVDTNKIAVAADGTLFLAGATLAGGSLRRLSAAGQVSILLDGLHVSDVAVLPDGSLVATTIEPGTVYRVNSSTGARTKLAG